MFPVLVRKEEREEERSICDNKRQDKATAERLTVDGALRFAPSAEKQVSAARVVFDQRVDNYNVRGREGCARLAT